MACACQQQQSTALDFLPDQLMGADQGALMFFIQGVKVGLMVKAAEQQKWTRLGVIMAGCFGALAFFRWYTSGD